MCLREDWLWQCPVIVFYEEYQQRERLISRPCYKIEVSSMKNLRVKRNYWNFDMRLGIRFFVLFFVFIPWHNCCFCPPFFFLLNWFPAFLFWANYHILLLFWRSCWHTIHWLFDSAWVWSKFKRIVILWVLDLTGTACQHNIIC